MWFDNFGGFKIFKIWHLRSTKTSPPHALLCLGHPHCSTSDGTEAASQYPGILLTIGARHNFDRKPVHSCTYNLYSFGVRSLPVSDRYRPVGNGAGAMYVVDVSLECAYSFPLTPASSLQVRTTQHCSARLTNEAATSEAAELDRRRLGCFCVQIIHRRKK